SCACILWTVKGVDEHNQLSVEGNTVSLSYNYPKLVTTDYFFWYRQHPGKPPQFLISHSASGSVLNDPVPGLKVQVEEKLIQMNISSATVADSAVYFCAVKPTVTGNPESLYKNPSSQQRALTLQLLGSLRQHRHQVDSSSFA
uniref:Immunoglobulin V-set domain-containing protein n=2 Tax=Haplochromini TaxID=319058 RepID=A0A3B4HCC7_9CICH